MKVTSVHPIIVSDNAEKLMAFYANLGFTTKHASTTTMEGPVYIIANGDVELEIMQTPENSPNPMPAGLYGLRINVDDVEAAVEAFKQNGGTILAGPFGNEWTKLYVAKDADGVNVTIMQHIRK